MLRNTLISIVIVILIAGCASTPQEKYTNHLKEVTDICVSQIIDSLGTETESSFSLKGDYKKFIEGDVDLSGEAGRKTSKKLLAVFNGDKVGLAHFIDKGRCCVDEKGDVATWSKFYILERAKEKKPINDDERQALKYLSELYPPTKNCRTKIYPVSCLPENINLGAKDYVKNESYGVGVGVIKDYGPDVMTNPDERRRDNRATFVIRSKCEGVYELNIEYAAGSSRPTDIFINNELVIEDALSDTTGGWNQQNQQMISQGTVSLKKGSNKLTLLRRDNPFPHIRNIQFIPTD